MKKYLLLQKDGEPSNRLEAVDCNDNRTVKELAKEGYKIKGRIKVFDDFDVKYVILSN